MIPGAVYARLTGADALGTTDVPTGEALVAAMPEPENKAETFSAHAT
jgi:hypothetical protein